MREEVVETGVFVTANRNTRCLNLLGGTGAIPRLPVPLEVQKLTFEESKDIALIQPLYLPWYKPNSQRESGWDKIGSCHYTVSDYAQLVKNPTFEDTFSNGVREMVVKLGRGLSQDIEILVVHDTNLDKAVIVDGCNRVVALVRLAQQSRWPNVGTYSIRLLKLLSPWAHVLYPYDFLPFVVPVGG